MRPVLQKKKKNYKLLVIYILIAIICIVGIGIALYMQYFQDEKIGVIFGITDSEEEDKYNDLKNNFNNIFTNDVENMQDGELNIKKINQNFDIVATRYKYSEQTEDITLEATIPNINIKSDLITEFNEHVKNTYKEQVDKCKASNEGFIYNVKYKAYVQENILSLVIYAELKEGINNQRLMIETYNYDIVNDKKVSLEELLSLRNIEIKTANNKIKNEIKQVKEKNDSLAELGYNMYKRDYNSDMYDVKNTKEYFLGMDEDLYVIYPYGNTDSTSEMDIVIFINK